MKMIVTDLDGTLLRDDKSVSDFTKRTLARCREAGVKTVFASGRGNSALTIVPGELFDAHIIMNGANALVDGVDLCDREIAPEIMLPFLQRLDAQGLKLSAEIDSMHYANFHTPDYWYVQRYIPSDYSSLPGSAQKNLAIVERPEHKKWIEDALPDELYMHIARDNVAMIMHRDATKMKAIKALAAHWGIEVRDVVAFGEMTSTTSRCSSIAAPAWRSPTPWMK